MKKNNRNTNEDWVYQQMMDGFAREKFPSKSGQGFKCLHCQREVHEVSFLSHVQNRNHCPYCLWSRHLDLFSAGDRLCACKGAMRPIALTVKRNRKSKYPGLTNGELMLVHHCQECGKLSINRIAADDRDDLIMDIFHSSTSLSRLLIEKCESEGINILSTEQSGMIRCLSNACQPENKYEHVLSPSHASSR